MFDSRVIVFPSKQRPRKISILGSDGLDYAFLIKGHEDLRQDERVMQVTGYASALQCDRFLNYHCHNTLRNASVCVLMGGLLGAHPYQPISNDRVLQSQSFPTTSSKQN